MEYQKYKFKKIDAFTTENSFGNPAGTIWLKNSKDISAKNMLKIAKELQGYVSEVGFIHKIDKTKYGLKFYSSEREVNFCGHATIALMYELFKTDSELTNETIIKIITNDGELEVENRISDEDAVFIMAPEPKNQNSILNHGEIANNLGIDEKDINSNFPISIINAGLRTLLVPITSLDRLIGINPKLKTLADFCDTNQIDIIEVFSEDVASNENDFRVRVFPAAFGYLEDPATGSGNSALGYYLMDNGIWNKETIIVEQGNQLHNFNIVKLQCKIDQNGKRRVLFGGGAKKRIDGEYIVYK